jgi:hypothetical protein
VAGFIKCSGCLAEDAIDEIEPGPDLDHLIAYEVLPLERDPSGRITRSPAREIAEAPLHSYSTNMEAAWTIVSILKHDLSVFLDLIDEASGGYLATFHVLKSTITFKSRDFSAETAICRAALKLARHFVPAKA